MSRFLICNAYVRFLVAAYCTHHTSVYGSGRPQVTVSDKMAIFYPLYYYNSFAGSPSSPPSDNDR